MGGSPIRVTPKVLEQLSSRKIVFTRFGNILTMLRLVAPRTWLRTLPSGRSGLTLCR